MLDQLAKQINSLKRQMHNLENNKTPTLRTYDLPDNPPLAAIEGEAAIDVNGKEWWYIEGSWHTC